MLIPLRGPLQCAKAVWESSWVQGQTLSLGSCVTLDKWLPFSDLHGF